MFFMHFVTLCRKCLKKTISVVYLTKCRSERMSGLIRNLPASRDMRMLEVRAGRAKLQIMRYFSWSVVCTGSGSSQRITTSVVEVLTRCLCNSWKRFLEACQNVGLHVVATVCDMDTNVKTMKLLGSTGVQPFFQFQNQAIATIYDSPHLKVHPNLFLKYDVQVESKHLDSQLPVIAKLEHVVNTYKQQKHFLIRRLCRLTPTWTMLLSVPWK